jgi:3-phosphoshikimate 1-carboxyvinyltransferase
MRRRKRSPSPPLVGSITVPGDKSISHRALIFAALGDGTSRLQGLNAGDDVESTRRCLAHLGVPTRRNIEDLSEVVVEGSGWDGLGEPDQVLDAGNSGTTIRCLAGLCAAIPGLSVLTGDETLRRRPMLRVVEPLTAMGAVIEGRAGGDLAPLAIRGGPLTGMKHDLRVASAQVKTALVLAGLRASGHTEISEPGPSRDHTERMLGALGAPVAAGHGTVSVSPVGSLPAADRRVPGDVSSALFLVAAALVVEGSDLEIKDVGLNPTRTGALEILKAMGARLEWDVTGESGGEPRGSIRARYSKLVGTAVDPALVPRAIDEFPILAVVASQAEGATRITGAGELRVKESDRIRTTAAGLTALGVGVETMDDGMVVHGPSDLVRGEVDAEGDHRIALAFAVAGLVAGGDVRVKGWSSVETSFPEFLDVLGKARGRR